MHEKNLIMFHFIDFGYIFWLFVMLSEAVVGGKIQIELL